MIDWTIRRVLTAAAVAVSLLAPVPLTAQAQAAVDPPADPGTEPAVTLKQIMADPDWIGSPPLDPFWDDDGARVYFERKRPGEKTRDLWSVDLAGGEPARVPFSELAAFSRPGADWSDDFTRRVYSYAGDLFVRDLAAGTTRQLTRTAAAESSPMFLTGDREVAFQQNDVWLVFNLDSGLVRQPAELAMEDDPAEAEAGFAYLEAKQLRLYRKLAEAEADEERGREHERELQKGDPARPPAPWYLGDKIDVLFQSLSPAGDRLLLATREKSAERGRRGTMPSYVTDSGYVEDREVRTRVNRNPPAPQTLVLLDLETRERHDLDLGGLPGVDEDPLAEIRSEAIEWHVGKGAERETVEKALTAPEERPVTINGIEWSGDGTRVAVAIHSVDNKDRWIATVDLAEGKLVPRHRLTDPGWINWRYNEFGWAGDDATLWLLSEEDGYSHLYTLPADAAAGENGALPEARQLTSGDYVVWDPTPSRDRSAIYYRANVDHPGDYDIYRTDLTSGATERLTALGGMNDFRVSPDESRLLVIHSELDRHNDLWVQENRPGAVPRRLTATVSDEFAAVDWVLPEIVAVPSSHVERPIYSKLYKPEGLAPDSSPPAVVFVHGAGYLQNSHKGWSGYFREFMFHTLLVQHGYVVLDMDYRASAGYGRDWRTAIYRQMGHPELEDIQDGVDWLVAEHGVDRERVGIYGGSYGGFMTFMALFRDPERFAAGAALRPVTDWAHYNHGYTSNILNTPEVDPMAYEKSSPIELAEGLARPLLIAAGMQDDNVFFQDTVLLVQRLIELEKEDFETAFYPLDPHGFVHPESWLDEYRRIFKLFERYVRGES